MRLRTQEAGQFIPANDQLHSLNSSEAEIAIQMDAVIRELQSERAQGNAAAVFELESYRDRLIAERERLTNSHDADPLLWLKSLLYKIL